ncbi:hypothetical protein BC833DRAFT_571751 [Globomyces pollinis-pini]|nr:hypothetical protein BC833DRAFT_571751 [Globomyces pollinis-pini]
MRNKSTGIISKLETIKAHIVPGNDHNIDQSQSRQPSAIQQNQSGQANPNNLDQQTTHSNANQSSLKNYPGIGTSHSQSSFVTNQASYMNNSNSNYTSNQQNVSTNGNYSQSNIAINSNSFANPGINSSKQSSSNNVTQPSGYKNSTANNSQQPLGTNGINSNNKLSGNQVVNQFLGNINQQSGNYVINENPGKQTSTPPTGRPSTPLDNKPSPSQNEKKNLPSAPPSLTKLTETISCSELNAILGNKPMKVLIFDIRPVEDYITGHIKWRSILLKPGVIAGGVINIEPTWLTSPHTVAEEIEAYLSSFGSTSNDLKKIFQSRNEMDLIVFYDDQSRTVSNPLFQKLFQSLYSNGSQMVLPKILSGGFEAWNNFICSSVSYIHGDWIEIGTGIGINDWTTVQKSISIKSIPITQTTHSRQSSSSPSSSMKSNVNYIPPAASNPIPTTVRSYQLGAGSNNSPQSSTDTATKTLDTADLRGADGKLDFQAMRKRLNSVGKSSEPQKQSENNPNTYSSSVQFGEFTGASAASTDSSRRVTMLDPGKVNITSSPTNVSQHSNDDQSNTQSPVEFAKKQTESFRAPAVIKPRTSSIKKNDASSPILRKNTFDDPFFGFRRSTYTTAPEPAANIQPPKPPPKSGLYGLKEPLIGLPSRKSPDPMSSDLNAAYQKYPEISLSSVVATSEPIKVSYPTAHSRSNSPAPQVALSDFNSRYPSLEPPSIPSKPASMSSSYTGPTALQDPTINQARPVQQVGIPIPPPKPSNIASSYSGSVPSTSITNQMNNLQLNQPKPITNYSSLNNNNSNTNYLSLNNNFNVSKPLPPPQSQLTNQFKQVNDNTSYQNNQLPKPTLSNSTSMQMNQNGQPYKSLNNQPVNTNNPPPLPTKPGQSSEMGPFVQSQHPPRDSSLNVAIRPGQNNIGMLPKPLPVPGSYQSPSSMGPYYSHSSAPPPLMPKQG